MSDLLIIEAMDQSQPRLLSRISSGVVSLGRDADNAIIIDRPSVSRRHGYLMRAKSQWVYCDNDSTNGSWINETQVDPGQIRLIRPGDILKLSDFQIRVRRETEGGSGSGWNTSPSILIFMGEKFIEEVIFTSENPNLSLGGPQAHPGFGDYRSQPEIMSVDLSEEQVKLVIYRRYPPILINGQVAQANCVLRDRDVIAFGIYHLLFSEQLIPQSMPAFEQGYAGEVDLRLDPERLSWGEPAGRMDDTRDHFGFEGASLSAQNIGPLWGDTNGDESAFNSGRYVFGNSLEEEEDFSDSHQFYGGGSLRFGGTDSSPENRPFDRLFGDKANTSGRDDSVDLWGFVWGILLVIAAIGFAFYYFYLSA